MVGFHDTAARRSATGLDQGARALIVGIVQEIAPLSHHQIVVALLRDRFGTVDDYYSAVGEVHGDTLAFVLQRAVGEAASEAEFPIDFRRRIDPNEAAARALLLNMPEADFRLAVEEALRFTGKSRDAAQRITGVCRNRGAPWRFTDLGHFEWVGDAVIEEQLLQPALAAINDWRFAGGVRSEFESARAELRQGTPVARKQAVHEAGCAVESAMKIVLDQHGVSYGPRDTAQPLFEHLVGAGLVPRRLERLVLSAATPRNQSGGHGAGAVPHDPQPEEAESVVAAAAGAIAYLQTRLP